MQKRTIDNYLRVIFYLSRKNSCTITNKSISLEMDLIPATITEALKRLHELGFVIYEKSYGVRLTGYGLQRAINITRQREVWELFLEQTLKLDDMETQKIVDGLESIIDEKITEKINAYLANLKDVKFLMQ